MRTRWFWIGGIGVAVAIVLVFLASYLAGNSAAAERGGFEWGVAAETGTALGTVLLDSTPAQRTAAWWTDASEEDVAKVTMADFRVTGDFQDRHLGERTAILDLG